MNEFPAKKSSHPYWIRGLYLLILAALVPLVAWNGLVQQLNAQASDLLMRLRGPVPSEWAGNIVLVAVDDNTARRFGPLPLKRSLLAEGLERLRSFGPRVLALDLILSEPSDSSDDDALVRAVRSYPSAVVSAAIESDRPSDPRWILPLPELERSATVAHVHVAPDPDGVVRGLLLAKAAEGLRFWALGLQTAALTVSASRPLEMADALQIGSIRIPAPDRDGRIMLINYAGAEGTFRRVSFASLLDGSPAAAIFRGKVCIVGVTAQGGGDRLFTPLSAGIGMSGIEIHANVVRTILDRAFLLPLRISYELSAYLLIVAACVLGVGNLRGIRLWVALCFTAAVLPLLSFAALMKGSIWPLGSFLAVFLAAAGITGTGEYALVALALSRSEAKRKESAFRVQAIAHEIKTPLTAIQGSSELISEQWVPDGKRIEMAGLIHKESKRLTEIVQTFLDVERMAAGTLKIKKQEVDAKALCDGVLERARFYAARKNIEIRSDAPPVQLQADPDLLSFAIYNLLTNAIKYSPKQTSVRLAVTGDDNRIWISVTDEGHGIAPAEQQKIFEKFYRLKRDEKGSEQGSGIGLALVKEIVAQHGGQVQVESKQGVGSRFTIVIPREHKE